MNLLRFVRMAFLILVLGLCFGLINFSLAGQNDAQPKVKGKGPEIIQLDLNKLPPDLAKELKQLLAKGEPKKEEKSKAKVELKKDDKSKGKGKGKGTEKGSLSLGQAIAIAEKLAKGEAYKADRKNKDGKTEFKIDLMTRDGEKTRVVLDGQGNRIQKVEDKKKVESKEKAKGPK